MTKYRISIDIKSIWTKPPVVLKKIIAVTGPLYGEEPKCGIMKERLFTKAIIKNVQAGV
jgi:hypothetical protein